MQPLYLKQKFICPHCQTLAVQKWATQRLILQSWHDSLRNLFLDYRKTLSNSYDEEIIEVFLRFIKNTEKFECYPHNVAITTCESCQNFTIWVQSKMIYPKSTYISTPNQDMPDSVKNLYIEAMTIVQDSPKGSSALLRLAVQKLMIELGESGKDINKDIQSLVAKGLKVEVQKALDICRVVGNNAVHPGKIQIDDTPEIAEILFKMLNFIVDEMITKPKEIDSWYSQLPQRALEAINKRDANTSKI